MARHLGIGKESVYGTPVALTKYVPYISEGITEDNQPLYAETVEARSVVKSRLGAYKVGGNLDFYMEPENCGLLLYGAIGAVSSAQQGETTAYKHTFTMGATVPPLTLAIGSDVTAGELKITSGLIKSMEIKCAVNELVSASIDIVGQKGEQTALSSPSFSALDPWVFHEGAVEIATVADTNVEAMTVKIENNIYDDDYSLGSRLRRRGGAGGFKVSGTCDLHFGSLTHWKQFYDGATGVAPANNVAEFQMELIVTGEQIGALAYYYTLHATMAKCVFDTHSAHVSKRDRTIEKCPWTALGSSPISLELTNEVTSY